MPCRPRLTARAVAAGALCLAACASRDTASIDPGREAPPEAASDADAQARIEALRGRFAGAVRDGLGLRFEAQAAGRVTVVAPDDAVRRARRPVSVVLPALSTGEVELRDELTGVGVRFAIEGAREAALSHAGGVAIYAGGAPGGGDLVHRASAEGTEDFLVYDAAPAGERVVYAIALDGVAGLRHVARSLELLDEGGAPRLRVAPPSVLDARGVWHAASLAIEGCAFDADPRSPVGRPTTPPGADGCALVVDWSASRAAYPLLVDPNWSSTSQPMFSPRTSHTATLLTTGTVLMAGGTDASGTAQPSAELYLAASDLFTPTGTMALARAGHTATIVASTPVTGPDLVLVVGGVDENGKAQASAERYDSETGTFTATFGAPGVARTAHAAAALTPAGVTSKVLLAGGLGATSVPLASAEVYDPGSDAFAQVASMGSGRHGPTATLLPSGQVLVAGGFGPVFALASAELYDPVSSGFTALSGPGSAMTSQRAFATATPFPQASPTKVLIAGGTNGQVAFAAGDVFDIASKTFSQTQPMAAPRAHHAAVLLPSGKVLLTGGSDNVGAKVDTEAYDPATNAFSFDATMIEARADHTATRLATDQILVAGGSVGTPASGAELLRRSNGDPCSVGGECASTICVKGLCCNDVCTKECDSCVMTEQDASDPLNPPAQGTCLPVKADETVKESCDPTENIEFALKCDGNGEVTPTGKSCKAYACDAQNVYCAESCTFVGGVETGCSADGFCDGAGKCQDKRDDGAVCGDERQCKSGLCVDGVCCDLACTGQCEACDNEASVGSCSQVTGAPHQAVQPAPVRDACGGDDVCAGSCLDKRTACTFPTVACGEGSTCVERVLTNDACSGGACLPTTSDCGVGYACDAAGLACNTSCATNADCDGTFQCVGAQCVQIGTSACEGSTVRYAEGGEAACDPYVCKPDGIDCRSDCNTVSDCVAPFVCDPQRRCVTPPAPPPVPTGCAVAAPATSSGGGALWLLSLVGACAAARRRRREVQG